MTDAFVFLGPTLPRFLTGRFLDSCETNKSCEMKIRDDKRIEFLPPAEEGDVLRLIPRKPKIIGIIDGYFENVPAVWHKEILYAMSKGIHVVGAASIGALRAAELNAFGMEGVGAIYEAFLNGFFEDDDEVAVLHGPAELGYPVLSEAMVNIRSTFSDAFEQSVINKKEHSEFIFIAKSLHYKLRSYKNIMDIASESDIEKECIKRVTNWLTHGKKDQKLIDAKLLLDCVIDKLSLLSAPKEVLYNFEESSLWVASRS